MLGYGTWLAQLGMMRRRIVILVNVLVKVEDGSGWWLRSKTMKAPAVGGRERSVRRQNFNSYVLSYCSM
jgi:hypothetical protein